MSKTLIRWWPAILMMAFIFALSSTPGPVLNAAGLGPEPIHIDGHFLMFTLLCITYYRGTKKVWLSILLTILYAISDEIHQRWTPGRSSSLEDVFVDSFGAFIAGGFLWRLQPILPKILRNWLNK
jgi:VanZ family protein